MKYRFRYSKRTSPSKLTKSTRLRLAGKDKLGSLSRLPEPIEQIRMDDIKPPKAPFGAAALKAVKKALSTFGKKISVLATRAKEGIAALLGRLRIAVARRLSEKKHRSINTLPLLFGASVASFLVCAVTGGYILLSLFLPYAQRYETVTIPLFQGKRLEDVEILEESFNLIIQYESNPEVADGQIISQSPSAGVTRKIYGRGDFCDILLVVSRQEGLHVPEGLVGSPRRDAALALSNCGLGYSVSEEYSDEVEKGTVIRTYPVSGSEIGRGATVRLTVSLGKKADTVNVPDLSGLGESDAAARIRSSGLSVGNITYVSSKKKIGTVVSQDLRPHTEANRGAVISFSVSAGEDFAQKTVPDLFLWFFI